MKKLREMKKNNKGFSLVELIVVIAIMVVLIAVLGSTILGYVDKSKYSKDMQALDSINTAVTAYVADPNSVIPEAASTANGTTLEALITADTNKIIAPILKETFTGNKFINSSSAFKDVTTANVKVWIVDGAVAIEVASKDTDFKPYTCGNKPTANNNNKPTANNNNNNNNNNNDGK